MATVVILSQTKFVQLSPFANVNSSHSASGAGGSGGSGGTGGSGGSGVLFQFFLIP